MRLSAPTESCPPSPTPPAPSPVAGASQRQSAVGTESADSAEVSGGARRKASRSPADALSTPTLSTPARRSRTQRMAERQQVARRVQNETTPRGGIHPAWYGVGLGLAIGLLALLGWSMLKDASARDRATISGAEDGALNLDAVDVAGSSDSARRNQAMLAKLPAPTPEQIAAEHAAKEQAEALAARTTALNDRIIPFLNQHCVECHGSDSQEADIAVHKLASVEEFLTDRRIWERVYRMINSGAMPPLDHDPLPSPESREEVATLLSDELYNFDCDLVYNPGRSTVQRLNRAEYNNTIRDLFGINLTPADKFPADDVGDGFDNIGDVLSLPPLLMEKYLAAAEEVTDAVIDTRDYSKPRSVTANARELKSPNGGNDNSGGIRVLASHGELFHEFDVGATGEYEIIVKAGADQAGPEKARFALKVGDEKVQDFEVQEHRKPEEFRRKQTLKAGKQKIAVRFLNDFFDRNAKGAKDRNLRVGSITLHGPIGASVALRSDIHNRFVTTIPGNGVSVVDAAQAVLRPIMGRAFRRDVGDAEVIRYAGLVRKAVEEMGESYEVGVSLALQAILVAPDFLFRLEQDPGDGESERRLNDFEIASRLSYFLWSTMPDDELLRLARERQLHLPDTLRQQLQRMLKDEKAEALVQNFAAQWLNLRNLDDVSPNTDLFKSFNNDLKGDMRRETELLFRTVMQEDRSVEELLSADFTFVNKRLAQHYGIEGVTSDEFERVSLKGTNRSGVLTHASVLTLTSNPGRTSPVKRGKWIMENIFGEAPPPPPPDVPALDATAKVSPDLSLREQLAKHREDPGCAACHQVMDPLGLGLENFDAIGRWREKDGDHKIDASGSLPSGESFNGPLELIGIVRNGREKFFRTLSDKMLTYAIGRGTEYYDKCTVDECLDLLKSRGNRFSALVEGIVLSDPFLKRSAAVEKVATK